MLFLTSAACGGKGNETSAPHPNEIEPRPDIAKVVNSDVAVGKNHLLVAVKDTAGQYIGSPERPSTFALFTAAAGGQGRPVAESPGHFIWVHEPDRGLYLVDFDIADAGTYELELRTTMADSQPVSIRTQLDVNAKSITPALGSPSPQSKTKTMADANGDLKNITTDPNPEPAFYSMSIDKAVTSGRASVIVFSTPARCVSNMCGPVLDNAKAARLRHPEVNFLHVEIYDHPRDTSNDAPVKAVGEWRLPTEPWVFVVDSKGNVSSKFESVTTPEEFDTAISKARAA